MKHTSSNRLKLEISNRERKKLLSIDLNSKSLIKKKKNKKKLITYYNPKGDGDITAQEWGPFFLGFGFDLTRGLNDF